MACFCGFPACISVRMFAEITFLLEPGLSGTLVPLLPLAFARPPNTLEALPVGFSRCGGLARSHTLHRHLNRHCWFLRWHESVPSLPGCNFEQHKAFLCYLRFVGGNGDVVQRCHRCNRIESNGDR